MLDLKRIITAIVTKIGSSSLIKRKFIFQIETLLFKYNGFRLKKMYAFGSTPYWRLQILYYITRATYQNSLAERKMNITKKTRAHCSNKLNQHYVWKDCCSYTMNFVEKCMYSEVHHTHDTTTYIVSVYNAQRNPMAT